ncbi:hypothetical protein XBI1_2310032 [Xenorhabdus bovienii str. Intermedium]|uniref:Uncharacterized protein n=1 Tax=Xenorhabdus bovienii str. Intermedium TaxID=1379677 RepID=A0A077QKY0_XENBV|nr:hypothetical protein XBI1_2310032 [Xenorhabdus bovienii str. Intermedium]
MLSHMNDYSVFNPRHFRWLVLILLGVLAIMSSTQVVRVLI